MSSSLKVFSSIFIAGGHMVIVCVFKDHVVHIVNASLENSNAADVRTGAMSEVDEKPSRLLWVVADQEMNCAFGGTCFCHTLSQRWRRKARRP